MAVSVPFRQTEAWRQSQREAQKARLLSDADYRVYWINRTKSRCSFPESGCWLWTGFIHARWGYGGCHFRGKGGFVHRRMYEAVHGVKLTRQQYVCHTCDTPHCCNPDHLWLGTNSDNQLDASRKGRHPEVKVTHCPQGHEYAGDNLVLVPRKNGKVARGCRACRSAKAKTDDYLEYHRKYQQRKRDRERAARMEGKR